MKNLKNYFIPGVIGLVGGLISSGSYGQVLEPGVLIGGLLERAVIAESVNHQEFQIECWRKFEDGEIVFNKFFDTNRDGEIDSFSIFSYSPGYNIVSKRNVEDTLAYIESFYPKWVKNSPLGKTFINCEEGYFKEDIYDYIKSDDK